MRRRTTRIEEQIIYEDQEILVCRKLPGIPVQSSHVGTVDLESAVKTYLASRGEAAYAGVIHRLDQPVQGIIVFAKNQRAAGELSRQMSQGEMEKLYLAAVDGIPCQEQDRLEDELEKIPGSNLSKVTEKKTAFSKKAILEYKVLKTQEGTALLEIRLYTGRHHQIRVQLAHRGMPICGDSKYNPKCRENTGQWQDLALCAYKLSFQHPVLKKKMEFTAMPVGNFPMV